LHSFSSLREGNNAPRNVACAFIALLKGESRDAGKHATKGGECLWREQRGKEGGCKNIRHLSVASALSKVLLERVEGDANAHNTEGVVCSCRAGKEGEQGRRTQMHTPP